MAPLPSPPVEAAPTIRRIAHAHGNRRPWIARALASGVEFIEADLRWYRGAIWVRHEHRLPVVPLLWNNRLRGFHRQGPFALALGPLWLRLDLRRLPFAELLARLDGRADLMLDLKRDSLMAAEAERFVRAVFAALEASAFRGEVDFCGSWELLDLVRRERPGQMVHYSIDSGDDAERLFRLAENGAPGITIHRDLLTAERAAWLRERGFDVIAWDIATRGQAIAAIERGASGIIADDLAMLRAIAGTPLKGDPRQ